MPDKDEINEAISGYEEEFKKGKRKSENRGAIILGCIFLALVICIIGAITAETYYRPLHKSELAEILIVEGRVSKLQHLNDPYAGRYSLDYSTLTIDGRDLVIVSGGGWINLDNGDIARLTLGKDKVPLVGANYPVAETYHHIGSVKVWGGKRFRSRTLKKYNPVNL